MWCMACCRRDPRILSWSHKIQFSRTEESGEALWSVAGNIGLPFTDNGFFNASFEYGEADPTSRSIQRNDAQDLIDNGNDEVANPAQVWGNPDIRDDLKTFFNLGVDLNDTNQFYMFGNYASKEVEGGFYFRNPTNRGGVYAGPTVDAAGNEVPDDTVGALQSVRVGDMDGLGMGGACPAGIPLSEGGGLIPDPAILAAVTADPNCWSFVELFPGGV